MKLVKRRIFPVFATLVLVFVSPACSVWEDREDCPCWLDILFDRCTAEDTLQVAGWNGTTIFFEEIVPADWPDGFEHEVVKGLVRTCVFRGIENSVRDGYELTIPIGSQADRVFLHRAEVVCSGEFAVDTVKLRKEWTTVNVKVRVDGVEVTPMTRAGESLEGYHFVVRGDICGTDLLTGNPIGGEFMFEPQAGEYGVFTFRLPRHDGYAEELFLDIYREGVLVDEMELGRQLAGAGYDWSEEDLSDVDMNLNMATRDVTITVQPWEDQGYEDIIF